MSYSELIQAYFERSVALQWYWTIYVLVIGGVGGFSIFRQRPEMVTTLLVTLLYAGFAFKNLGLMVTINQRLDFDQIELIAGDRLEVHEIEPQTIRRDE